MPLGRIRAGSQRPLGQMELLLHNIRERLRIAARGQAQQIEEALHRQTVHVREGLLGLRPWGCAGSCAGAEPLPAPDVALHSPTRAVQQPGLRCTLLDAWAPIIGASKGDAPLARSGHGWACRSQALRGILELLMNSPKPIRRRHPPPPHQSTLHCIDRGGFSCACLVARGGVMRLRAR